MQRRLPQLRLPLVMCSFQLHSHTKTTEACRALFLFVSLCSLKLGRVTTCRPDFSLAKIGIYGEHVVEVGSVGATPMSHVQSALCIATRCYQPYFGDDDIWSSHKYTLSSLLVRAMVQLGIQLILVYI